MSIDSSKDNYPKVTHGLITGSMLVYIGGLFLTVSFFSPYWISSYEESFSTFKNMGVWEYCFENFRFPYYQYDRVFDGCRGIFNDDYYVIREWLLPGWLLAVQFFISIALFCSLGGQLLLSGVVIRYPQQFVLRYEHVLITVSCVGAAIATFCILMMIIIFPLNCWRRDWMMYPRFNRLAWAYYCLFFTFLFHFAGSLYLYTESRRSYNKRKENKSLVMQMYPHHDRNGFY